MRYLYQIDFLSIPHLNFSTLLHHPSYLFTLFWPIFFFTRPLLIFRDSLLNGSAFFNLPGEKRTSTNVEYSDTRSSPVRYLVYQHSCFSYKIYSHIRKHTFYLSRARIRLGTTPNSKQRFKH